MKEYFTIENEDGTESKVEEPQSLIGFTYADYLRWNFKEQLELIRGRIFKKCAAPSLTHQSVVLNIANALSRYVAGQPCKVYLAPADVRLKGKQFKDKPCTDEQIRTVVQPDVCVVCDASKLKDTRFIDGPPDLVIEVLSPGNTKTENQFKLKLYEENGIREYWVVMPGYNNIMVFMPDEQGLYGKPVYYEIDEVIGSEVLPGFYVKLSDIFKT